MTPDIRPATPKDLAIIQRWRRDRADWLAARGSNQWSEDQGLSMPVFTDKIIAAIAAGQTWMAEIDGKPVGTITVNDESDPDLWSESELRSAVIIHAMIVDQRYKGHGIGTALLAQAEKIAREHNRAWIRLDAWTTNTDLHAYYKRAGFHLVRIADPHQPSTALFERKVRGVPPSGPRHAPV